MTLELPNLDDRRWADLVEEARALIPFYAPDWTDHNIHDPGITLIELFAWIAETDIYRVNRVPDAHRRRFLRMVGADLKPPSGARTALAFELELKEPRPVRLPAHTQLRSKSTSRPPMLFQTLQELTVMPGRIEAIQSWDGREFSNLTRQWKRGEPISPFGPDPRPGAVLYVGFQLNRLWSAGRPLTLYVVPTRADAAERERLCRNEPACIPPPNPCAQPAPPETNEAALLHHSVRLVWETHGGSGQWFLMGPDAVLDETRAFTLPGRVVIVAPNPPIAARIGKVDSELFYFRCRFVRGAYDATPELTALLFNSVDAEQTAPVTSLAWSLSSSAQITGTVPRPGQLASFDIRLELEWSGDDVYEQGFERRVGTIDCVLSADAGETPLSSARVELIGSGGAIGSQLTDQLGKVRFRLANTNPQQYTVRVSLFGRELELQVSYAPIDPLKLVLKLTLGLAIGRIDFGTACAARFRVLEYDASSPGGILRVEAVAAGIGSGRPNQEIELPETAVAGSSLRLHSLEEHGWHPWTQQADFITSSRTDSHYLLDPETGRVLFGDGEHGRVVPPGTPLVAAYLATSHRLGNLPARSTFEIADTAHNRASLGANFDAARNSFASIKDPLAAEGGKAGETLDEATSRVLEEMDQPVRAVTLMDYEILARRTPGVRLARAAARANVHPAYPCFRAPGVITLVVIPFLPAARPSPSPELMAAVAGYLGRRRVLGTRVEVIGPEYKEVAVRARVRGRLGVDGVRLAGAVRQSLDQFFHPLTGGPKSQYASQDIRAEESPRSQGDSSTNGEPNGWPLGRDVYRSEVLQIIDETDGVDHVLSLEFLVNGETTCGNVCIPPFGMVASGTHEIEVV